MILLPGFVRRSLRGETRSSFRMMSMRFGCSPPSRSSGASSSTIFCASTSSLLTSLKCPLRPQLHRMGSRKTVSSWRIAVMLPQLDDAHAEALHPAGELHLGDGQLGRLDGLLGIVQQLLRESRVELRELGEGKSEELLALGDALQ